MQQNVFLWEAQIQFKIPSFATEMSKFLFQ